ncbi:MAG: hypothetical protein WAM14_08010 [Candidatus Nitrosopolaris sp.]
MSERVPTRISPYWKYVKNATFVLIRIRNETYSNIDTVMKKIYGLGALNDIAYERKRLLI